jgi:hypothetical protein
MKTRFSRVGLVGRYEDPLVADSASVFAAHLLSRGLEVKSIETEFTQ